MTNTAGTTWLETSSSEIKLARIVAQTLNDTGKSVEICCKIMQDLALCISARNAKPAHFKDTEDIIERLLEEIPFLSSLDISQPFPRNNNDLTTNFFNCLASEIGKYFHNPLSFGMVGTPPILAIDMVSLAAASWLTNRTKFQQDITAIIMGQKIATNPEKEEIAQNLMGVNWYDPCVGGGVFPLAILLLLNRFGVQLHKKLLSQIFVRDRDPLSVTATNIRIALLASSLSSRPFEVIWQEHSFSSIIGDSLEYFTEQTSLLGENQGEDWPLMDIVVGNPPYVRASRIATLTKDRLKKWYPSVAGGRVDLYNYFIAHGLLALKQDGVLCYVSPASFQKSEYGRKTRGFIESNGLLCNLFDFDELPVFNGISVHSSVYVIKKTELKDKTQAYLFDQLPKSSPLLYGLEQSVAIPAQNVGVDGWHINITDTALLIEILQENAVPLINYVGQIFSGIKTGYQKAYFISQDKAKYLGVDKETEQFVKPLLRPICIRTWRAEWDRTHLILVKKDELVPEKSRLMQHFRLHESALRRRTDIQNHSTWYGLRECSYYDVFLRPKIIFPDIASDCRFAMDTQGFMIPDGAFVIPSADYFLLGLLNSCIGSFYFRSRCNSIGNPKSGGRLRFKKTYVKEFPSPRIAAKEILIRDEIADLSQQLVHNKCSSKAIERIDELALQLYKIPSKYRKLFLEI